MNNILNRVRKGRNVNIAQLCCWRVIVVIMMTSIFLIESCGVILEEDIEDDIITILAPADNASISSNTVTFWWETLNDVDRYRIQIVQPDFENTVTLISDTTTTSNQLSIPLNSGAYAWRIRGENSAYATAYFERSFSIDTSIDISSSSVTVNFPTGNLNTNETAILFDWEELAGANNYRLEIAQPDFTVPFTTVVDETTTNTTFSFAGEESSYAWQITANNIISSSMTVSGSFTIDLTAPDAPVLISPIDDDTLSTEDITFEWQSVSDASQYQLYIMSDVTLLDTVLNTETINTESVITGFDAISYYWNVRAEDAAENLSEISETRRFVKQ